MKNGVAKAVVVMIAEDKEPGTAAVAAVDDGDDEGLKKTKKTAVVDDCNRNTAGTHNRHTAAAADHSTLHTQTVVVAGNSHNHIAGAAVHTTENNTPHRKAHQDSTVADQRDSSSKKRRWCRETGNGYTVQVGAGYTVVEREMMLDTREVAAAAAG